MLIAILCLVLLAALLVYASYSIRAGIYLSAFCRSATRAKVVYLTFDDGPDSVQTPKVLDVLRAHQASACFFCIGRKVAGNEAVLLRMVHEGHLIGNHSYTHSSRFPLYSYRRMLKDVEACDEALTHAIGHAPSLFRPPFGVTNPTVAKVVGQRGYTVVGWTIRTFDTRDASIRRVVKRVDRFLHPGAVILLHDRLPHSDVLLEVLLRFLRRKGYRVEALPLPSYG